MYVEGGVLRATMTGGVANHDMTVGGTLSGASQNTTFTAR